MRVLAIDLMKICSIFLVIVSHVTLFFLSRDSNDVWLYFFRQAGQLGVSVFFMCSGYFLLNNKRGDQAEYVFAKIRKISFVLAFWLCFYYLYDQYFIGRFTAIESIGLLNFFNISKTASEATHLWFIFSIIALYVLTPLLHGSFAAQNRTGIARVLVAMLVISNLTLVNAVTDHLFGFVAVPFNILLPFQAEGLLSFLIGGYLGLSKVGAADSQNRVGLVLLFVISFSVLSAVSHEVGMTFFYGKFYNLLLQLSAVSFFLLGLGLRLEKLPPLVTEISNNVLGIYLVHNIFVVEIHGGFIHQAILAFVGGLNRYVYIVIYSLLSFILSFLLCVLLRRSGTLARLITL